MYPCWRRDAENAYFRKENFLKFFFKSRKKRRDVIAICLRHGGLADSNIDLIREFDVRELEIKK